VIASDSYAAAVSFADAPDTAACHEHVMPLSVSELGLAWIRGPFWFRPVAPESVQPRVTNCYLAGGQAVVLLALSKNLSLLHESQSSRSRRAVRRAWSRPFVSP
jgi:hypothetical protein